MKILVKGSLIPNWYLRLCAYDNVSRFVDTYSLHGCRLLIVAGHDTTAATLSWTLWELSKHPEIQVKLRAEIHEHRLRVGKNEFTSADYDSMPYLNAILKVLSVYASS